MRLTVHAHSERPIFLPPHLPGANDASRVTEHASGDRRWVLIEPRALPHSMGFVLSGAWFSEDVPPDADKAALRSTVVDVLKDLGATKEQLEQLQAGLSWKAQAALCALLCDQGGRKAPLRIVFDDTGLSFEQRRPIDAMAAGQLPLIAWQLLESGLAVQAGELLLAGAAGVRRHSVVRADLVLAYAKLQHKIGPRPQVGPSHRSLVEVCEELLQNGQLDEGTCERLRILLLGGSGKDFDTLSAAVRGCVDFAVIDGESTIMVNHERGLTADLLMEYLQWGTTDLFGIIPIDYLEVCLDYGRGRWPEVFTPQAVDRLWFQQAINCPSDSCTAIQRFFHVNDLASAILCLRRERLSHASSFIETCLSGAQNPGMRWLLEAIVRESEGSETIDKALAGFDVDVARLLEQAADSPLAALMVEVLLDWLPREGDPPSDDAITKLAQLLPLLMAGPVGESATAYVCSILASIVAKDVSWGEPLLHKLMYALVNGSAGLAPGHPTHLLVAACHAAIDLNPSRMIGTEPLHWRDLPSVAPAFNRLCAYYLAERNGQPGALDYLYVAVVEHGISANAQDPLSIELRGLAELAKRKLTSGDYDGDADAKFTAAQIASRIH